MEANETFATIEALVKFETETTTAIANLKMYADDTFATIQSFVQFQTQTTNAIASVEQYVDSVEARVTSNTQFINQVDGRVDTAFTQISQVSDKAQSAIDITAGFNNQMARLEIRVDDMGSEINATADTVNIHSSTLNAHSDSINIIADCVRINGAIHAGVLEAHEGYFDELKAGTGTFGNLYAKKSEISNIVNGILKSEKVDVKNLTASGIGTTQLRVEDTFSFQGYGIKWQRLYCDLDGQEVGYTVLMRT